MEPNQPRPIDTWTRDELISAVDSLLTMNVAAMEVVYYIQQECLEIEDDELLRRIQRLAGAYYLTPPLPGE